MSNRPIKTAKNEINPMFPIPDGVDELVYDDDGFYVDDAEDVDFDISFEDDISTEDVVDEEDYSENPDAPRVLGVVSQTIRTNRSGSQVVDVVFKATDIPKNSTYDIRVSLA